MFLTSVMIVGVSEKETLRLRCPGLFTHPRMCLSVSLSPLRRRSDEVRYVPSSEEEVLVPDPRTRSP